MIASNCLTWEIKCDVAVRFGGIYVTKRSTVSVCLLTRVGDTEFMIQNLPPEILCLIFHYACVDQGATAHSLFLTSKYISSVTSPFLFNTLCLPGVDRLERALCRLAPLPPYLRQVYHLFVADGDGEIAPERSLKRLVRYSSPATTREQPN
jgi:F-box-like